MLNLNEVAELRGWSRENGSPASAPGSRTPRRWRTSPPGSCRLSPRPRAPSARLRSGNRGTIGGNLGTASPAGDALPPLLVEGAELELAKTGSTRTVALSDFLVGPKQNTLAGDELIVAVRLTPSKTRQTFMKVGPQRDGDCCALARPRRRPGARGDPCRVRLGRLLPGLAVGPLGERAEFPERLSAAASPIDDVRGTAAYRRHALRVLTARALERVLT